MTEPRLATSYTKHRTNRIFFGWWIVAGGFSLQLLIGSLMIHSFTAYFPLLQSQFGWSRGVLSGAFALSRAESGLLGPLQGWLIDKIGPRMMARIGILLFGIGFIYFSQINSILDYYIAFLLMAMGSSIAGMLTIATTVVNWFIRRRSVAMGIAMSGFGIGGLLVPVVAWSLTSFGWRPTSFVSGVIIILIGMPIAQLMRHRPEPYGQFPDGDSPQEYSQNEEGSQDSDLKDMEKGQAAFDGFTAKEAMKTQAFWFISIGHSAALITIGAVSLHLVPHIIDAVGISITAASTAVVVMTIFNIVAQLAGGFLGDMYSKKHLAGWAMIMHAIALFILANATSMMPVYLFAALHGTAWGVRGPMMATIRADYFGRSSYATIMGFSSLIVMLGMTFGPLFAGFMSDIFGGYKIGFIIIAIMTGASSVFFFFTKEPALPIRLSETP